eukprot:CAMPEP_0114489666 /NCGR_PEP_ID=MMETSP0109-20121206/2015_1 /TAXON_ID=29199 /ORGANISM="Chlorarachnion reptans, Strain CCCM449" /LENGTH=165 /DNA_ID=CAMNT_0001666201 /DNA_START=126 /DNA_END=623 /DNA_ORIENTATION=-
MGMCLAKENLAEDYEVVSDTSKKPERGILKRGKLARYSSYWKNNSEKKTSEDLITSGKDLRESEDDPSTEDKGIDSHFLVGTSRHAQDEFLLPTNITQNAPPHNEKKVGFDEVNLKQCKKMKNNRIPSILDIFARFSSSSLFSSSSNHNSNNQNSSSHKLPSTEE